MSLPRKRGEVWARSGDGTSVYVAETDEVYLLNPTAFAIWELCDGDTTADEMAEAVSELTGLELEDATREVVATLVRLGRLGMVSDTNGY